MNRTTELSNILTRAQQCYYMQNNRGGITDAEYDRLKKEYANLVGVSADDPILVRVGPPYPRDSHRKPVKHAMLIGSLNDIMNVQDLKAWWPGHPVVSSLKVDGLTMVLNITRGRLVSAATRGDGAVGEDITDNAVQVMNVPTLLADPTFTGSVRGECFLALGALKEINEILEEEGEEPFANPRNAASGILRADDGRFADRLSFIAHGLHDPEHPSSTQVGAYTRLATLGFDVVPFHYCQTIDEVIGVHATVAQERPNLSFWIDGVVVLVDDIDTFNKMGVVHKRPKGGIAFKFPPEEAVTDLVGVTVTVGHTGKIHPTAVLNPVQLGGATIRNATLCNWDEIERLGVHLGDKVVVVKNGDVIPGIDRVMYFGIAHTPIHKPTHCPVCGGDVSHRTNTDGSQSADIYCNNLQCPAKLIGKIRRWIKSLGIKGIGDEILLGLMATKFTHPPTRAVTPLLASITDLYRICNYDPKQMGAVLVKGKKLGEKRAATIQAEITKTRTLTIDQFIGSLGIFYLGKRRVTLIRAAYNKSLAGMSLQGALDQANGWLTQPGDTSSILRTHADVLGLKNVAEQIQTNLDSRREEIMGLLAFIDIKNEEATPAPASGGPLEGQIICVTGTLSQPRKAVHEAIQAAGGQVTDEVNGNTTILCQADPSSVSSKSKKAQKLGIKIIGEADLMAMIAGKAVTP